MAPHVTEPGELFGAGKKQVVTLVLLGTAVIVKFARKAQVKMEARNDGADAGLSFQKCLYIVRPESRALLADKDVVDVDLDVALQTCRELAVREERHGVQ